MIKTEQVIYHFLLSHLRSNKLLGFTTPQLKTFQILALLLLLFPSTLFAIEDLLFRGNSKSYASLRVASTNFSINTNYPLAHNTKRPPDVYNNFFYSTHFRIIVGKKHPIKEIENILDIAENVWNKEIEELGFKMPSNANKFYIDIYLANTNAYNPYDGAYITIDNSYAGYTSTYNDGTPYIVINNNLDENIVKITLAHEFFHTIQYAYGLNDVSDDIWNKNIWFMEATATMIEDVVYDDVNDYINFVQYYLPYTYFDIEYCNGGIEYGKSLFAIYLKEKYGLQFVKRLFERYDRRYDFLHNLDVLLKNYLKSSLDETILEFGNCLIHIHSCFEEGAIYPDSFMFDFDKNLSIGHYGIALYDKGSEYLIGETPQYLQSNFNGQKLLKSSISNGGLIVVNKKTEPLNNDILQYNRYNGLQLKAGWNMITNIFNEDIEFENFKECKIVWVYRNKSYYAYSYDEKIDTLIKKYHYETKETYLKPKEAAWIYCPKNLNVTIGNMGLVNNKLPLKKGWNFVSLSNNAFKLKYLEQNLTIWNYDKIWRFYSRSADVNYSRLLLAKPQTGYFILKE